jgi:DNA polymerase V
VKLAHPFSTPIISFLGVPFFSMRVQAGFPSPADDSMMARLDLNQHLIKNPNATFFMRAGSDAMTSAGIRENDLLLIDRSIKPKNNSIVIAVVDGEFAVRRLKMGKNIYLTLENEKLTQARLDEDFHIWGVVTSVIHRFQTEK